jgi:hypothetical protein
MMLHMPTPYYIGSAKRLGVLVLVCWYTLTAGEAEGLFESMLQCAQVHGQRDT